MRLASLVIGIATDIIIEKGKKIASHLLEASIRRYRIQRRPFRHQGHRSLISAFSRSPRRRRRARTCPTDLQGKLDGIGDQIVTSGAWPSGTHICEVEIDPDTGMVQLVQWSGVDDVGLAINPMILHGQTHGAAAQGIGQALLELCHYDRDSGAEPRRPRSWITPCRAPI